MFTSSSNRSVPKKGYIIVLVDIPFGYARVYALLSCQIEFLGREIVLLQQESKQQMQLFQHNVRDYVHAFLQSMQLC